MGRKCKPGMKARVIRGASVGRIVIVIRRYFGERVNGQLWDGHFYPWVVTSLGAPLRVFNSVTLEERPPAMTAVCDDSDLEPIPDGDGLQEDAGDVIDIRDRSEA